MFGDQLPAIETDLVGSVISGKPPNLSRFAVLECLKLGGGWGLQVIEVIGGIVFSKLTNQL
jgi:hypothetical protein